MSANNAVTVLRSPSAASAWFVAETSGSVESTLDLIALVPDAENFEPHLRQNLEPDGLLMPHEEQTSSIRVPHSLQNKASGRFSALHLEHSIDCSQRQLIEERLGVFQIGQV